MSRYIQLLFALFVFTLSTPALAFAPDDGGAPTAEAKAADSDGAKALAADAKAEAKPEEAKGDDSKPEEAKGDDAKAGETEGSDTEGADKPATKELDPESNEEAVEAAKDLYQAISDKNWAMALALGLALLVWVLRKVNVLNKVPAKAMPWVAAVLSAAGYVVAALMSPGAELGSALAQGVATGAAAVGLWEMLLKHFLGKKKEG